MKHLFQFIFPVALFLVGCGGEDNSIDESSVEPIEADNLVITGVIENGAGQAVVLETVSQSGTIPCEWLLTWILQRKCFSTSSMIESKRSIIRGSSIKYSKSPVASSNLRPMITGEIRIGSECSMPYSLLWMM